MRTNAGDLEKVAGGSFCLHIFWEAIPDPHSFCGSGRHSMVKSSRFSVTVLFCHGVDQDEAECQPQAAPDRRWRGRHSVSDDGACCAQISSSGRVRASGLAGITESRGHQHLSDGLP